MKHIALFVPDLQLAERYYQTVFDMELIGREAELADGLWYTLPFDKGWEDAEGAGIQLGMVALRKKEFVLALFRGDAPPGQVFAIGISMPAEEIVRVRAQLAMERVVSEPGSDFLEFRDMYGINWQVSNQGSDFKTAGIYADRWLPLE